MSLKRKALRSFGWSFFGELISKTVGPLIIVVLAKVLMPEDFGIIAAATVVISFSQVFWDAGLSKTLIQRSDRVNDSATVIFWINVGLSFVFLLVLIIISAPVAELFDDHRVTKVIRVLALQLPLAAICSVQSALAQREFQFRRLFWVRLATTVTPAIVSIPLALKGFGYWALVAGTLLGQLAQVITLWLLSSWRPTIWFDTQLAKDLFRFGRWVMLSAFLGWFFLWVDALIVGGYLGMRDLGVYRTGDALVTLVFGLFAAPVLPVIYSLFSRLAHDARQMRDALSDLDRAMMIVALPLGVGLLVLRDIIPDLVFTDAWPNIGYIIGVLGITHALSYTVTVKQQVYRAIGKPQIETQIMTISMVIRILFYVFSVQYGLIVFVWARLASTALGVLNHLVFAKQVINVGYSRFFKDLIRVLPPVLLMYVVGRLSYGALGPDLNIALQAILVILICAVTYGAMVLLTEQQLFKKVYYALKSESSLAGGNDGIK